MMMIMLFTTSLIDHYAAQPDSLEMMCLADFAVNYDASYSTDTNKGTHDDMNPDNEHDEHSNEDQNSQNMNN